MTEPKGNKREILDGNIASFFAGINFSLPQILFPINVTAYVAMSETGW
jgi:hypothetical protein